METTLSATDLTRTHLQVGKLQASINKGTCKEVAISSKDLILLEVEIRAQTLQTAHKAISRQVRTTLTSRPFTRQAMFKIKMRR